MFFRAVLDDSTCCILEGESLGEIKDSLDHNRFIRCFNQTTGNEELVATTRIRIVRKSSKTLQTIIEENQQKLKKLKNAIKKER